MCVSLRNAFTTAISNSEQSRLRRGSEPVRVPFSGFEAVSRSVGGPPNPYQLLPPPNTHVRASMDNLQACFGDSPSLNELLAPDPRIQGGGVPVLGFSLLYL